MGLCTGIQTRYGSSSSRPRFFRVTFAARGASISSRFAYAHLTCWERPSYAVGQMYQLCVSVRIPVSGPPRHSMHLHVNCYKSTPLSRGESHSEIKTKTLLSSATIATLSHIRACVYRMRNDDTSSPLVAVKGRIVHSGNIVKRLMPGTTNENRYFVQCDVAPGHEGLQKEADAFVRCIRITIHFDKTLALKTIRKIVSQHIWSQISKRVVVYPCKMYDASSKEPRQTPKNQTVRPGLSAQWNVGLIEVVPDDNTTIECSSSSHSTHPPVRCITVENANAQYSPTILINAHPQVARTMFFVSQDCPKQFVLLGDFQILNSTEAQYPICANTRCQSFAQSISLCKSAASGTHTPSNWKCECCSQVYEVQSKNGLPVGAKWRMKGTVIFRVQPFEHKGRTLVTVIATCFNKALKMLLRRASSKDRGKCWAHLSCAGIGLEGLVVNWVDPF